MSEEKGIKESLELLQGLKRLVEYYKKAMADGKLGVDDLAILKDVVSQFDELMAAGQGLGEIPAEAKDLSGDEVKALADKAIEIVAAFKSA